LSNTFPNFKVLVVCADKIVYTFIIELKVAVKTGKLTSRYETDILYWREVSL